MTDTIGQRLLMVDLLAGVYWFDDALQAGLKDRGWEGVTRAQSLVLTNLAAGVRRPSALARNVGVSRQAMSQTLSEMVDAGLISMSVDPTDRRASLVSFSPSSEAIRDVAVRILLELETILARRIGEGRTKALKAAASADWGPAPTGDATDGRTSAKPRRSRRGG